MADKKKAVKIFLINKDKEILLQLRDNKPGIYYPGYWGLLGGAADAKELDLEAIKREVKEEINYDLNDVKRIGKIKSLGRNKNFDLILFKGHINIPAEKIVLNEGRKVEFFKLKEALNLRIPEYLMKFLNENKDKIFN